MRFCCSPIYRVSAICTLACLVFALSVYGLYTGASHRLAHLDLSIDNVVATSLKLYRSIPASCTSRQHASPHLRKEFHPTQTLTYFELLDYHCPRIAVEDLQKLVEQKQVLVVDLRSQME